MIGSLDPGLRPNSSDLHDQKVKFKFEEFANCTEIEIGLKWRRELQCVVFCELLVVLFRLVDLHNPAKHELTEAVFAVDLSLRRNPSDHSNEIPVRCLLNW